MYRTATKSALSDVRVAVCGHLPTAYDYLLGLGVVHIDQYTDAVNLHHDSYDLILVYAPQGEGLMNTWVTTGSAEEGTERIIPLRLLDEPTCHSALVELSSKLRRIVREKQGTAPGAPAHEYA